MMPAGNSLTRSIVKHGVFFFLGQGTLILVMTLAYGMSARRLALFLSICAAFHAFLTAILLLRRDDFRLETSGETLDRVNLSNTLTFGRMSSLPAIIFLVIQASDFPATLPVVLPFLCLVFATDFLDGIAARRRKEITFVGKYLDSTSDYLTIIAVTILLSYYGLIETWFLVLVLVRLVFFALGMGLLAIREGKANPLSTVIGKVSIFSLMVLYAMEVARIFEVPWIGNELVVRIVSYVVALIVLFSIVDKAIFLGRRFAHAAPPRTQAPRAGGSA